MIHELKSKIMKTILVRIVIGLITIGIITVIFAPSIVKMLHGPKDMNSVPLNALENTYVKGEIINNYGNFYYFYEYENGRERITANYYIIPIGDEEYCAMVLTKDFSTAEQIYNETYDYLYGNIDKLTTSLAVKGTFEKMDETIQLTYLDFFKESGFTQEEIERIALPYVLVVDKIGAFNTVPTYIAMGVIGLLFIILIIDLIKGLSGRNLINVRKIIEEEGPLNGEEKLETDYLNAFQVKNLRIGQKYTYFIIGAKAYVLKNRDIVWAYLQNVTHRVYGIKTATNRSIIIYDNKKRKYTISLRKEQDIISALNYYANNYQNIVIGYNEELKKIYNKDYDYFLTLAREQHANNVDSNYSSEL